MIIKNNFSYEILLQRAWIKLPVHCVKCSLSLHFQEFLRFKIFREIFLLQLVELHCSTLFLMKTTPQVYPYSSVKNTLLDYQMFDRNDDERRPEFFLPE